MRPSAAFFIASLASLLRTHAAPGDLDPTFGSAGSGRFSLNADPQQWNGASLALQSDGKIIAAGGTRLVRILPDGTLDTAFNSGGVINLTGQTVGQGWQDVAVQSDGKILACSIGSNHSLRRWNSDGTPDTSFNGTGGIILPSNPFDLTLDEFGRILVGLSSGLARYAPNGTLDATYGQSGIALGQTRQVTSVAALPGGTALVMEGWNFGQSLWGQITKLDASGAENLGFPMIQVILGLGKMEVTGQSMVYCYSGVGISRIDFQGNAETIIEGPSALSGASGFTVQRDSRLITAGAVSDGWGRYNIAISRFLADGSLDNSFANGGIANVHSASYQITNARTAVQRDGKIVVAVITDAKLVVLRLLGDDPDLTVEHPLGTNLAAAPVPTIDFGPVVAGQSQTRTVYLSNRSPADLEGLKVVRGTAGTPAEFTIVSEVPATLATGESVPLTLVLTPSSPGKKTATFEIQSNDPDESPFTLSLTGRQATATDLWRQTHFGSMDETGIAADQSDPDADGIPNLVEFALGSHPKESTPTTGTLVRNGSTLEFTYWRSKAALGEIAFVREFSQSLADGWSQVGGMVETIIEETTDLQKVRVNTPAGTAGRRFVRLRVTRR